MDGFVHLHVHSEYSLLDGANRVGDLVTQAAKLGMGAIALTDHGNLFGAVEFYLAAAKAKVKPIMGMEAFISPTHRRDRSMGNISTASYHMLLLATNDVGWHNLVKLSSRAYLEGFYYRPRIDRELLAELNDGLICTTACLGGEVPSAYLSNQPDQAERIAREYLEIFGKDRFYIELQNQGMPEQDKVNPLLAALAKKLGVRIVGTNDVHFLTAADKPSHEVLTAISTGKTLTEGGALVYSPHLWLKGPADMRQSLAAWPEAAEATLEIAARCNVKLDFKSKHLPRFKCPDGQSADDYLRKLVYEGLERRFGKDGITDEHRKRMEHELSTITIKGYSSYVLIVHDFVQFARANNIPCGARGSGCATLMGYCLGISDVDPMRYGLLFERFTDVQRDEDPDFDIDMCQEGRPKVIDYVRRKYGQVAQIITYGTLKARAVVRDVGRVLDMPLAEVDAIAKKVPEALNMTIALALESEPSLKEMIARDARVAALFEHAQRLEGLARHAGVHAAGVVIADEPLENLVPLSRQADTEDAITQWDGVQVGKVGLMKMDFLGLRTLTTLQRARELAAVKTGKDIDPETIPLDDQGVFEDFRQGRTQGVFQFESGGMQELLRGMKPTRLEDLIAANAMYRPGPMELIPTYNARKAGAEPVPSVHPLVDGILAETYGIMVYQEQVMQVLNRLGKLPLNTALTLIKAISKKKESAIAAEKPNFMAGARENGISEAEANALFDLILKFAGYGFNKAHSTRYAVVAYQTAWFKHHYPRQFMAAVLTFESGDTDKVVQYRNECERMGISLGPPDINASGADFTVDGDTIRFGLAAIKGVGDKAVEQIMAARAKTGKFRDLFHFCESVDLHAVNRSCIEAMIKCGAFDLLGASRAANLAAVDHAIELGQSAAADRKSGQMTFFGGAVTPADRPAPRFPDVDPLSATQLAQFEKETLGFYVTSHPLVGHARLIKSLSTTECAQLKNLSDRTGVVLGCLISGVRQRVTKAGKSAGKKMAILSVEDLTGSCEAVVWAEQYEQLAPVLVEDAIVFIQGTLDRRRETPQLIVEGVVPIEQAMAQMTGSVEITIDRVVDKEFLTGLGGLLSRHRGRCPVDLKLRLAGRADLSAVVRPAAAWHVEPSGTFYKDVCELVKEENVRLVRRSGNGNGKTNGGRSRFYQSDRYTQRPAFAQPGQAPG